MSLAQLTQASRMIQRGQLVQSLINLMRDDPLCKSLVVWRSSPIKPLLDLANCPEMGFKFRFRGHHESHDIGDRFAAFDVFEIFGLH